MFLVYDVIYSLFFVFYFPMLLFRGKWHSGFWMRLGFMKSLPVGINEKKKIWIHAVSVGEVLAVKSLVEKIRQKSLGYQIVISVVTQTGYRLARSIAQSDEIVIFAPLDFSWVVKKYVRVLNPKIYINAETEIWPNLLTMLHQHQVVVVQVNGRVSDRAFKGYQRIQWLLKPALRSISCFCMQTQKDALRIQQLGALPETVKVVGNIKFDDIPQMHQQDLKRSCSAENRDFLIAGSTHPGEEKIFLDIFQRLKTKFSNLRLILAPRHPERTEEICALIRHQGLQAVQFSQIKDLNNDQDTVIVVDTIGHLKNLYSVAKIVFVGKSLTQKGGHNIIEPAYFKKPIIIGPHMQNFQDVVQAFRDQDALVQVDSAEELLPQIEKLLSDEVLCQQIGNRSFEVVQSHQGAEQKTINVILRILQ